MGTRREAQNLPMMSPGSLRMAVSEHGARWAGGSPEAATSRECPPWPAPGRGHRHVSRPGHGGVYFQGEAGSGFQVGVRGNTTLTHTLSLSSCPRLLLRNRAPFSLSGEPACVADSPRSGKGGKVNEMNAWPRQEPGPLHLHHILLGLPRKTKQTQGIGKGPGLLWGSHWPRAHSIPITHGIPKPSGHWAEGAAAALGFPTSGF